MRRALLAVVLGSVGAAASFVGCSVYDESLLGAGGGSTSGDGDGDGDGDGGAGAPSSSATESTTASTGDTSATTSGSTGSVTTGGDCETPDDCPGDDSECATRTCEGGLCSITALEQGVVLSRQSPGDCVQLVCDGQGGIETVNLDTDVPADDGDDCTEGVCVAGDPDHVLIGEGSPCAQDGGALCNAAGVCVECLVEDDCDGTDRCSEGTCVAAACDDGILNNGETDTDCGGPVCGATCLIGDDCDGPQDCLGNACNVTCQPSCTDGILNNGESAMDCGGPCAGCALGLACGDGGDCGSGFCPDSICRPQIFFSEYVEGSSLNKAVEVFNYGNEPVDLAAAACSVLLYNNGAAVPDATIGLTGTIAEFGVRVLCNNAGVSAACNQSTGALNHNGDDALALVCGGFVLDVFGQIGLDPGTEWGSGLTSTVNHTLRRQGGITEGDRNGADAFEPSDEWDGFAIDTFGGLGVHP